MFTIGKLASLTSVSNDTLRYYEQEGLVEPAGKSPAGYRLYDKDSARRIRFIKHAQNCGFTLAEIRDLLVLRGRDKACCGDVRTRAVEKKLQIESKIRAMKAMSKHSLIEMEQVSHIMNEKRVQTMCFHPLVTNLHGCFQDDRNLYMVMEFVKGAPGSLPRPDTSTTLPHWHIAACPPHLGCALRQKPRLSL